MRKIRVKNGDKAKFPVEVSAILPEPKKTPGELISASKDDFRHKLNLLMDRFHEETGLFVVGVDFLQHRQAGRPVDKSSAINIEISGLGNDF